MEAFPGCRSSGQKEILNGGQTLPALFGWSTKDENPNNAGDPRNPPHEDGPGGPAQPHGDPVSSAILADALTSSSKPGGPSADGGEDCVDSDTRICTRVPRANDPFANLDASAGNDDDPWIKRGTKLGDRELKKIADDIQLILDANPGCLPYINGILGKAASPANPVVSKNPLDIFWATRNQVGFYSVANLGAGGYTWGSIGKGNAKIELLARSSSIGGSRQSQMAYARTQELETAETALNEGIHASGAFTYDDIEMSIASSEYANIPLPDYGLRRAPPGQSTDA